MIEGTPWNGYTLTCDHCEEEEELDDSDFQEVVDWARDNGWKTFRDESGNWVNHCPDCASTRN